MKKTKYILSDNNEEEKKAMEDAETNLSLLMKEKKTKLQAFVKFMGSLPKHSRLFEVEVLKVGERSFTN